MNSKKLLISALLLVASQSSQAETEMMKLNCYVEQFSWDLPHSAREGFECNDEASSPLIVEVPIVPGADEIYSEKLYTFKACPKIGLLVSTGGKDSLLVHSDTSFALGKLETDANNVTSVSKVDSADTWFNGGTFPIGPEMKYPQEFVTIYRDKQDGETALYCHQTPKNPSDLNDILITMKRMIKAKILMLRRKPANY